MRLTLTLGMVLCAGLLCAALPLIAAEQAINLDHSTANGSESRVSTRVLQTFPVRIENTIYNNAPGSSFTFRWPGAGPGGFASVLTVGPGVGTVWTWTTVNQVYSIDSPITFTPVRTLNVFGSTGGGVLVPTGNESLFMVPGKSIVPNQVTVSSTSLTSSLITFFSPKKTVASCGADCDEGGCDVFLENSSGDTVTMVNEQQDCCLEPNQTFCDGVCTSYLTDVQNCGGCGNVCAFDEFCGNGVCEKICEPGEEYCGGACINPLTDPLNCGGCGNACGPADFCDAGVCSPVCPNTVCGELCVDTQTDPLNCGGCGNVCAFDEFCGAGSCQEICPGGALCGETCVDPLNDPLNCGGCGIACGANEFCDAGTCRTTCTQTLCGEQCVDISSDPFNCGACGNVCPSNHICAQGACVRCRPPQGTACNNVCVNIHTDPFNCGACGNVCDFSSCPSTGEGTCSMGSSCQCAPAVTGTDATALSSTSLKSFKPIPSVKPFRLSFTAQSRPLRKAGLILESSPTTAPVSTMAPGPVAATVVEAPVCDLSPITQVVPSGERYTQTQTGGRFHKEIQTTISIVKGGKTVAEGPCPLLVPVTDVDTSGVILSPAWVATRDASGDSLCQPGEAQCDFYIAVSGVGDSPCVNPMATLSSPTDTLNPNPIAFLNAVSPYPTLPGYPGDGQPLLEATNTMAFSVSMPADQAADVGRVFQMTVTCQNLPDPVVMPLTLGIGTSCDPARIDGDDYDSVLGFAAPVNALLTQGGPVNYANGSFNRGKTIPLKMTLGCGGTSLLGENISPHPEIVSLVHETLGPRPLQGINGDNNANPDDPLFRCGSSGCEYQFRTELLTPGRYVMGVQMPDSRVFQAGIEIRP